MATQEKEKVMKELRQTRNYHKQEQLGTGTR